MKNNLQIKTSIISTLFLIFCLAVFLIFEYRNINITLTEKFISQGKFLLNVYTPLIKQAIYSKDDTSLIDYIQNIMEQKNIVSAVILDSEGKVLGSSNSNEIGKIYGSIAKQFSKQQTQKVIKYIENNTEIYEFCNTFNIDNKEYLLKVKFSFLELKKFLDWYLEKFLIITLIISIFWFLFMYFFAKQIIVSILKLKKSEQENLILKFQEEKKYIETEKNIFKNRYEKYLKITGKIYNDTTAVILTDYDNKIIYFNEKAKNILYNNKTKIIGEHIFNLINNIELIELIKNSSEFSNESIEKELKSLNNKKAKVLSIKDDNNNLVGSVILIYDTNH